MQNHAMGSSLFCMASIRVRWSTGLSALPAAGRNNMEVATIEPIHVTVASKCNQNVSAIAQVGGGVMELVVYLLAQVYLLEPLRVMCQLELLLYRGLL